VKVAGPNRRYVRRRIEQPFELTEDPSRPNAFLMVLDPGQPCFEELLERYFRFAAGELKSGSLINRLITQTDNELLRFPFCSKRIPVPLPAGLYVDSIADILPPLRVVAEMRFLVLEFFESDAH
jgi:hypothetical protein